MSETANTIIKAALRAIGAIATGETPTHGADVLALEIREVGQDLVLRHPAGEVLQDAVSLSGHCGGRPVAVNVYRLISRMEVRAPLT